MKRHPRTKRPPVESTKDFNARLSAMNPRPPAIRRTNPAILRGPGDKGYGYPEPK